MFAVSRPFSITSSWNRADERWPRITRSASGRRLMTYVPSCVVGDSGFASASIFSGMRRRRSEADGGAPGLPNAPHHDVLSLSSDGSTGTGCPRTRRAPSICGANCSTPTPGRSISRPNGSERSGEEQGSPLRLRSSALPRPGPGLKGVVDRASAPAQFGAGGTAADGTTSDASVTRASCVLRSSTSGTTPPTRTAPSSTTCVVAPASPSREMRSR